MLLIKNLLPPHSGLCKLNIARFIFEYGPSSQPRSKPIIMHRESILLPKKIKNWHRIRANAINKYYTISTRLCNLLPRLPSETENDKKERKKKNAAIIAADVSYTAKYMANKL